MRFFIVAIFAAAYAIQVTATPLQDLSGLSADPDGFSGALVVASDVKRREPVDVQALRTSTTSRNRPVAAPDQGRGRASGGRASSGQSGSASGGTSTTTVGNITQSGPSGMDGTSTRGNAAQGNDTTVAL